MPNYRRVRAQGGTFFFTVVTYQRQNILINEPARQALRFAVNEIRRSLPFLVDAWVLLPDHLHCIWTLPEGDDNYSLRWLLIKQSVSRRCAVAYRDRLRLSQSRQRRREAPLWQRRFWEHQIRDETDFERHVDYIHWNPVKHELVTQAAAWPYSTFHRYVRDGAYTPDWGLVENFDGTEFGE
jgi:REP-associated tyrosine transposase